MTKETAERAADLIKYIAGVDEELIFWDTATGIKQVVVESRTGPRTIAGQFSFLDVREARVSILNSLKKEWADELENL